MKTDRTINFIFYGWIIMMLYLFIVGCKPSNLIYDSNGILISETDSTYYMLFFEINGNGGRYIQFNKKNMITASKILENKGYDFDEINSILLWGEESLDYKTRDKFNLKYEPIHLYESYYIGDGNVKKLNKIAKEQGYDDYQELLIWATNYLNDLAEEYEK